MGFSTLILFMIISAIVTYAVSKQNSKAGAYLTVLFSTISLLILFLGKSNIGNEFTLLYMNFKVTAIGWYFSIIMVLIYSSTSFFNPYWMEKILHKSSYNFLYMFSLAATVGLFFSADLITLFIFWEIVVWSSTFIVPLGKSRRAAVVYYTISSVGSMATLFAIMFVYSKSGTFNINEAFAFLATQPTIASFVFFTFIMAGLTKIGIFPFHIWLPLAHGSAPHTFSPVLSGGLVKMGAFIAYISVGVLPAYKAFSTSLKIMGMPVQIYLLMVLGAISMVVGTLMAIKQDDAKKLIAYSSVANGGYILVGLLMMDQLTFAGALMHIFNHAIASAAAFLTIAAIAHRTGTTKISELGGMIHKMPVSYVVYLISIISLAGIPPMGGFVSKWLIVQGLASKGLIFIAFAAFFGSIGSFLYVFRPLAGLFLGQLAPKYENIKPSTIFMKIPMVILAAMSIFFGVFPKYLLAVIGEIQSSIGIDPIMMNGNTIVAINGVLNSNKVALIFGFGFMISLVIFLVLPKSRKVGLMDTFTSAEFIYTPELYHYANSFYAPFERLYKNHPSVEKFLDKFAIKTEEFGLLINSLFFSHKPSITVFWAMAIMTLIFLGGVNI
ncbi:proton-conducting transporter transmembrane domain-containing protein [Helicovermis profundi]|uniref:Proton-conducting transporter membrane subunit n=1 Tax=Helicovermis profundi TaxID=3065157 RepID=A0AAU9E4C3_9FIRM|nr:proton-conducting transporter membrane subunit [Clostridia bacterium S502]